MTKKPYSLNFILGASISTIMFLFVLVGFFWTPYDTETMNSLARFEAPNLQFLFGADQFGRDVFSRVMAGAVNTTIIGVSTVLIGGVIGTVLGALTGYYGGWFDEVCMRVNDAIAAFPSVLIALVIIAIIGGGRSRVILALGIAFIPSIARFVRGEFLKLRDADYIVSARLIQVPPHRIILFHIMPNILPALMSALTISMNNAILAEAGMSYLGIGVQPPDPSLGRMLAESQTFLSNAAWTAIFPGLVIILFVLGIGLLGEGILDRYGGGR